jgi:serine/threonine-protein kinase HipA
VSLERRDLAMICGDDGRHASAKNLLSQSARFLLKQDRAATIVEDMARQIRNNWYPTARAAGVSEQDCAHLSGAFVYPGFHQ